MHGLLREADVVIVLASLNAQSRHMIGAAELALMKRDAVLINISRGAIIDEQALVRHLQEGGLAKAALDAFEVEPLPADSPLRSLPNVILTPHAIGHSQESFAAIPPTAVRNALAVLGGQIPESTQNRQVEPEWRARFPDHWSIDAMEAQVTA